MSLEKESTSVIEGTLYLELAARFVMEPEERIISYKGQIELEEDDGFYRVGSVNYCVARVSDMLGGGFSPVLELYNHSEEAADYCEFFDAGSDGWSNEVMEVWPDAQLGDMVILNKLVVYPPFRGAEIGLLCLGTLMRIIGGARLFVMRPMPLQYAEGYAKDPDVAKPKRREAADVKKLMAYYARAGFREMRGTGKMALDPTIIGPMDKWGNSWACVTLKRNDAMEKYRLAGIEEERRRQEGGIA